MSKAVKPLRVFKLKWGRRLSFYKTRVRLDEWCSVCKNWTCLADYYTKVRSKAAIRAVLAETPGNTVIIGCKTFRGAAVTYARKWVKS